MEDTKVRPRKPVTTARIEVSLWFDTAASYETFARVPFGPYVATISDRTWVEAWDHGERGITARLAYAHMQQLRRARQRIDTVLL